LHGDKSPTKYRTNPLQLFMDGRAQAAYNRDVFDEWSYLIAGGKITYDKVQAAQARGEDLTYEDYRQIGRWMDTQLTKLDVWLVLMPASEYNNSGSTYHVIRGIENDPNWPLVFFDEKQRLYVNKTSSSGKKLFEGILSEKTLYPDDYHANLNRAHNWVYYRQETNEQKKRVLDLAIKAFNENPSRTSLIEIIQIASNFKELSPMSNSFTGNILKNSQKIRLPGRR